VLLVALPRGLGQHALGSLWRPAYPLILPFTLFIVGNCISAGAGVGLHALGAARRSLRAMLIYSGIYVVLSLIGAAIGGAAGTVDGCAVAGGISALLFWLELRAELRSPGPMRGETAPAGDLAPVRRPSGRHRAPSRYSLFPGDYEGNV
jgi:hypothetical protein